MNGRRCSFLPVFALAAALLMPGRGTLLSQTPLGIEAVLNSRNDYYQSPNSVACDGGGNCAIAWEFFIPDDTGEDRRIFTTSLNPQGEVLSEREIPTRQGTGFPSLPNVVGLGQGFTIVWNEFITDQAHPNGYSSMSTQTFDQQLSEQGETTMALYPSPIESSPFSVGRIPGGYVLVALGEDSPPNPGSGSSIGVFLLFFGEDGQPIGEPRQVNQDTSGIEQVNFSNLAVDGRGNVIVPFWRVYLPPSGDVDVFVRRFSPEGQPLGPEVRVNSFLPGEQKHPQVAAAPTGEFLVVWQSEGQDGDHEGIYGQFFSADGTPAGPEFRVNNVTLSAQRFPRVAADPHGNFIVVWRSFILDPQTGHLFDWDVKGRLFRPDGTPVAGEILINQDRDLEQGLPLVAFAPNGTFLVTWDGPTKPTYDTFTDVHARRFAASMGEEPCVVSGPQLLCDTGWTGGVLELQATFARRPGDVPLLGDWDGDGREDFCAFRAGRFRCDLDHEGLPAEAAADFGRSSDIPLLGDVDGDGRAEPCLRRNRRLLCDTGHNGGKAEVRITFGGGDEVPLLGDLDGDGRDDLCLVQDGEWSCLTRKGVRMSFSFGTAEDAPTLGDLDRDGRSDPCVLREGVLLCDTAHDGGEAEGRLALKVPAGARPVFGNVDGL